MKTLQYIRDLIWNRKHRKRTPSCDVIRNGGTLVWSKAFKEGEAAAICISCAKEVYERERQILIRDRA